jgi:hypothetical protein
LNDIVVGSSLSAIKWNPDHHVRVLDLGVVLRKAGILEPSSIRENMNEKTVSRADYGTKWPLKVESGTSLRRSWRCDLPNA